MLEKMAKVKAVRVNIFINDIKKSSTTGMNESRAKEFILSRFYFEDSR